ncbi:MAG: right-handed parallel beta-helix repeat-containing protein, partial [Anaerolineae bacterium]|nr:right-handed parallel beta-helix repeat-containing protein [Anaerolineae bacterium]
MIIRERSIPGRPFVRHVRLSWPITVLVLVAGLAGLWLSAGPAYAQEGEPPPRVITRPHLAYPTPEMIAVEPRPERDDRLTGAEAAQPPARLRRLDGPLAPSSRPWVELAPEWPVVPQLGVFGKDQQADAARFAPAGPSAPLAGTFTVNSTADTHAYDNFLTLREALLVANGALTGPFSPAEQAQLIGCSFNSSGWITGGCGANIHDTIFFAPALGFRPVITLAGPLPPISDTRPTLLLGAFLFNNVQPVINAQNLTGTQPGLVVQSNDNRIAAISVISAPGAGIRINGNQNTVDYWTMARNNRGDGIYITGLTNTVQNAYIGVFSNTLTNDFDCAGNLQDGIYLASASRGTTIRKNIIRCNGYGGVHAFSSSHNLIGGSTYITNGNWIADNTIEGILLNGSNARHNVIQANDIYSNFVGVTISAGQHNTITAGLDPIDDYNYIYANASDGIQLRSGAKGNLVAHAVIDWNGQHGVNLIDSGTATNTLTRTLIMYNGRDGIRQDSNANQNLWREM